jgi:hypothetical protein
MVVLSRFFWLVWLAAVCFRPLVAVAEQPSEIDFNRDIRPILSNNCFKCHGPDPKQRQAGLRLDLRESALQPAESGAIAIVPTDPAKSELVRRIATDDDTLRMPPLDSHKKLTTEQKTLLARWIEQGAEYKPHWAFVAPIRNRPPEIKDSGFRVQNEIDAFVVDRLRREGLRMSPEAGKEALIRRVTLDLTGLPPTIAEIDEFLADDSPTAYEKVVDRLLASPRFGEHLARYWLDAARFADTNGYQMDLERSMWPWRDWVIAAYNRNLPFDQFTIEQIAGDLLPKPTRDQLIATGFNRNHCVTIEGGVIDEEYRVEYVMDRVTTTATTWLGLTLGCCRCHDHKYDPFTQKEFYQLFAYFNQVTDRGHGEMRPSHPPRLAVPTEEQQAKLKEVEEKLAETKARLESASQEESSDNRASLKNMQEKLHKERAEIEGQVVQVMVMHDSEQPRETFVLDRGQYDLPKEKVAPNVPSSLPPLPVDAPRNRLALARWLVDPANPLTARVIVNRDWQRYFGAGLMKTVEDFGVQAEWPSHPELLDWLATEFVRSGWDIKHMQRLVVTSATYRQGSHITAELLERDPENRLLARGPRMRLSAEQIRDSALAASGLLSAKMGGPSVNPYQPDGLWTELNDRKGYSMDFVQSHGEDLYRRGLYTFWKRTVPPPAMQTFDAPEREFCVVRRLNTNTPLQALVLLNDIQMVEAARKLAERMLTEGGAALDLRLKHGFRLATARRPSEKEINVLRRIWDEQRAEFSRDPDAAKRFLKVGESPVNEALDIVELATCAHVARLILNLDEAITKQ